MRGARQPFQGPQAVPVFEQNTHYQNDVVRLITADLPAVLLTHAP